MERIPTSSSEQPLDLSAGSSTTTLSAPAIFQPSYPFDPFHLVSRQLIVPSMYTHNQSYSLGIVSPRLGDDSTDSSCRKSISLVSPRVEPESSTTPKKSKRCPSVGANVDKSSLEYRKKRIKNNEAARKSRQKKKETEVEMKRKMSDLKDETALLRETVNRLQCLLINQKCLSCSRPMSVSDKLYRYDMIPTIGIGDRPSSSQQR